jgi:phospholipase C
VEARLRRSNFDEGGGYYDSGYVQPLTFFGDGPRIPLMVVSPYAKKGYVDHTYDDHVSILKFIERNWHLSTLSDRSLDNLPDPQAGYRDPYKPINGPAIGDLMDFFSFAHPRQYTPLLPYSD